MPSFEESQHPRDSHGRFALRQAGVADHAEVSALVHQHLAPTVGLRQQFAKDVAAHGHGAGYVAQDRAGKVIGYGMTAPGFAAQDVFEAGWLVTHPDHRGKGVAGAILGQLEHHARAHGGEAMVLATGTPEVYRSKGYRTIHGATGLMAKPLTDLGKVWDESRHPRAHDGEFSPSTGVGLAVAQEDVDEAHAHASKVGSPGSVRYGFAFDKKMSELSPEYVANKRMFNADSSIAGWARPILQGALGALAGVAVNYAWNHQIAPRLGLGKAWEESKHPRGDHGRWSNSEMGTEAGLLVSGYALTAAGQTVSDVWNYSPADAAVEAVKNTGWLNFIQELPDKLGAIAAPASGILNWSPIDHIVGAVLGKAYDESKHPRGEHGRWAHEFMGAAMQPWNDKINATGLAVTPEWNKLLGAGIGIIASELFANALVQDMYSYAAGSPSLLGLALGKAWEESKHPRLPPGDPHGGEFTSDTVPSDTEHYAVPHNQEDSARFEDKLGAAIESRTTERVLMGLGLAATAGLGAYLAYQNPEIKSFADSALGLASDTADVAATAVVAAPVVAGAEVLGGVIAGAFAGGAVGLRLGAMTGPAAPIAAPLLGLLGAVYGGLSGMGLGQLEASRSLETAAELAAGAKLIYRGGILPLANMGAEANSNILDAFSMGKSFNPNQPRDTRGQWTATDAMIGWAARSGYSSDATIHAVDHARGVYNEALDDGQGHDAADASARDAFHQRMRLLDGYYYADSKSAVRPNWTHEALALAPPVLGAIFGSTRGLAGAEAGLALGSALGAALGGISWFDSHTARDRLQSNPAMHKEPR